MKMADPIKSVFRVEDDLRTWVTKAWEESKIVQIWIEQGSGSSVGTCDLQALHQEQMAFVEFKCHEFSDDMIWKVEMRPAQYAFMRNVLREGFEVWVLVAQKGGAKLGLARGTEIMPDGLWPVDKVILRPITNGFDLGVKLGLLLNGKR